MKSGLSDSDDEILLVPPRRVQKSTSADVVIQLVKISLGKSAARIRKMRADLERREGCTKERNDEGRACGQSREQ